MKHLGTIMLFGLIVPRTEWRIGPLTDDLCAEVYNREELKGD